MKPVRKNPVVVVRPVKDADKAKAAAAALKSRQILSGTAALHRYIEQMEALEASGWNWK